MKLPFTTLDVFTSTRYAGNPLAIISLPATPPNQPPTLTQVQKQAIAKEFNLSETVFLHLPPNFSPSSLIPFEPQIDIFTTASEVPFAGHPTIGTTWFLLNVLGGGQRVDAVHTKAGRIAVGKTEVGEVQAEIPTNYHLHEHAFTAPLTGEVRHPVVSVVMGMNFILVEVPTLDILGRIEEVGNRNLNPGGSYDPSLLDEGWQEGLVGTMYLCAQGEDASGRKKHRTRMHEGSLEDPGTGSASCGLACYLAGKQEGDVKFLFEQGVEMGRRNVIGVSVEKKEKSLGRVVLSGKAVVVMEGTLEVPDA